MYLPPGTYEVSKTIYMNTDTIIMGDATNVSLERLVVDCWRKDVIANGNEQPPVIRAASNFWSDDATLLSGSPHFHPKYAFVQLTNNLVGQDPATGISGELSFTVGLKNIILDTTKIPGGIALFLSPRL